MTEPLVGGNPAVPIAIRAVALVTSAILRAARQVLIDLRRCHRIDAAVLRSATLAAFRTPVATGGCYWKLAIDACEVVILLFLQRYRRAMRVKAMSPAAVVRTFAKWIGLVSIEVRERRDRTEQHGRWHDHAR